LGWFWRGFFYETWKLDQGVKDVKYVDGSVEKGSLIAIENLEKMAMPVTVEVTEGNGKKGRVTLPVEVWQRGGTWTFRYNSTSALKTVVVDPDEKLPDVNSKNNTWRAEAQ
jgi:hypothetical protein